MIYEVNEDSDFLMHHGIKGQKWGVENGPPYPLNKNEYSALEKKMAGVQAQSDATNRQSMITKQAYKSSYGKRGGTELMSSKLEYQTRAEEHFIRSVNDARNYIGKLRTSGSYYANKDAQKIFNQYEKAIDQICKETSTIPKEFADQARYRTALTRKRNILFGMPGTISAMTNSNNKLTQMFNDPKLMAEWDKYINS